MTPARLAHVALASLFALSACRCDEPLAAGPDDDGGQGVVDAGFADGGFADGGFADAGLAEAGPFIVGDAPVAVDAGPCDPLNGAEQGHICEGDEDLCEPVADVQLPDFDVLALWSRVEGNEFVVDALFRRLPFSWPGQLTWLFRVNTSSDDDEFLLHFNEIYRDDYNGPPGGVGGGVAFVLSNQYSPVGTYPADLLSQARGGFGSAVVHGVDPAPFLTLFDNGHIVELRLPLAVVARPDGSVHYAFNVNFGGDVTCGDEFSISAGDSFVTSRSGRPDAPLLDHAVPGTTCVLSELSTAPCLGE